MYVMYVYILVLVLCNISLVYGCPLFSMSMFTMHLVTNVHQTNQGLYLALPHVIPYIKMIIFAIRVLYSSCSLGTTKVCGVFTSNLCLYVIHRRKTIVIHRSSSIIFVNLFVSNGFYTL